MESKETYKERIEAIDIFAHVLKEKIEEASSIMEYIEDALKEEKTNLRGVIKGSKGVGCPTQNLYIFILSF